MKTSPLQRVEQSHIRNAVVPLVALRAHPSNYNVHPEQQLNDLKASHRDLGQFQSIVVWQQADDGEYLIVSGHGFVEGARRDGATEVRADILPPETPAETIEAILVAANLHQRNSVSDDERLGRLLQKQRERGVRLSALGTDEEAVRQLLKTVENSHATDFLKPLLTTPTVGITSSLLPAPTSRYEERHEGEEITGQTRVFQESGSGSGNQHRSDSESSAADMLSATYVSFMVSVTPDQRQTILSAIKKAQQRWQLETSQNALTAICQQFLAAA